MIYTVIPIRHQVFGMSEVLSQSLLLSIILCNWVDHLEKRWLMWLMGVVFFLVISLPILGLLLGPIQQCQPQNNCPSPPRKATTPPSQNGWVVDQCRALMSR